MNSDAIAYHYSGPKVWLRDAVIRPVPDEALTAFPAVVETLIAALMPLGGERAPQLFSVGSFVSLLLMAASLSFALFGLFCGISLAAKYTTLISWVLLVFCCFAISILGRRQSSHVLLKGLGASCAVAIVIASPFYLRNWVLFGSPIYPPPLGLLRFFPATRVLLAVLLEIQKNVAETGAGMGRSLWSFLLLPFHLTYHTADFRGAGGIGLAPLAFAPLGLIAWRRDLFVRGLALFAFLQMIAWFFTAQVSRYALHIYVLVAIFAVLGLQYAARVGSKYARALSCLIVACSVGYGLYMIISARVGDMHAALSPAFEEKRRHDDSLISRASIS